MIAILITALLSGSPQTDELTQQCKMILSACTGGGPVPLSPAKGNPHKRYRRQECQDAAEAAEELRSAAQDLAQCASRQDLSDDCSRKARAAKDAAEDYESKVSDLSGDCP